MSAYTDDEWLRRIFPLLTRREHRLCVAIDELAGAAITSGDLAARLELGPAAIRNTVALLEQRGVVWRVRLQNRRMRLGFSPDLDLAAGLLRIAGRRAMSAERAA